MTIIDQDMREIVSCAMLSYVATVCPDGAPNLSPKGSVMVYDDMHLIFMDQASPNTMANLRHDSRIEVNTVDVFRRRGYRFKGKAEIMPPGDPAYEWLKQKLIELNGPGYPANEAALIAVESARPLLSPAYTVGHAAEADLVPAYAARYVRAAGLTPDDLKRVE